MSMECNYTGPLDYSKDGMTKQSFKDQCDINKILKRAQRDGAISHLQKYPEAVYGEFADFDLLEAHDMVNRAHTIFADLPSEVRKEFNGDAFAFAEFASHPDNAGKLQEVLPALAAPGRDYPNPVKRGGQGAAEATAHGELQADPSPGDRPKTPPAPSEGPAGPSTEPPAGGEPVPST